MSSPLRSLTRFCLELSGLSVLATGIAVIAAYYVFGGFGTSAARQALVFCLLVPILSTLPIQVYAATRLRRLERQNGALAHVATRDGLTQVLNRDAFKRAVQGHLAELGSNNGKPATLLIIDADHFKRINDRLGHPVGDTALTAIAGTLRRSVRRDDLVGRLGGEEFGVYLRGAGPDEAAIVAERLRATIERIFVGPADRRTRLSVSIGGISLRSRVAFDAVYKIADTNLYQAKRSGRNRAVLSRLGSLGRGGVTLEHVPSLAPTPPAERLRLGA
ncbi:GGDEF domain-containing protein [Aureimonas jatrophae]|nr:GGDEF domain-containing protein [Aureimonas jatrophae]MBB3952192.1 diguanylate cyclase (GGDEF)-like protein [Aureimonas jatrophae]